MLKRSGNNDSVEEKKKVKISKSKIIEEFDLIWEKVLLEHSNDTCGYDFSVNKYKKNII